MASLLVPSDIFDLFQLWRWKMLGMAVGEVVSSVLASLGPCSEPRGLKRVCGLPASTRRGLV